ncbi:MAG: retron St85 family effector protein [Proteobacteria bacterium]|nr:retron St85 family effector protein [Pseudomonadota bacterium]
MRYYNKYILSDRSAVFKVLYRFRQSIDKQNVWRPADDIGFIFLCGGNIDAGIPSKRREALIDFVSKKFSNIKIFLAEKILNILKEEGHVGNILDIENDLSKFADYVIIVLESSGAFCELGAFASSEDLRKKLIIINDSAYTYAESFVNLGPLKAIEETSGRNMLLHYSMDPDGLLKGDGIGQIYNNLSKILSVKEKKRRTRMTEFSPNEFFNKDSLRFMHDLINMSGPIYTTELRDIIKVLFGHCKKERIQQHLGLLVSTDQIRRLQTSLYKSNTNRLYFEYESIDIYDIISAFKILYLKNNDTRLQ